MKRWDEDSFFVTAPAGRGIPEYDLLRVSPELKVLASRRFPGYGTSCTLWNNDHTLALHTGFEEGMWLLDGNDLSIRASITDRRSYCAPEADGLGRFWVCTGGSTLECYDRELILLSRHRLKGGLMGQHLDDQGPQKGSLKTLSPE